MVDGEKVVNDLLRILKGWYFCFIDALGRLEGNIMAWKKG